MARIHIGFRGGSEIKVEARDADKFLKDIAALIQKSSSTAFQWYSELGVLFLVNEIVFVYQEPTCG